MDVPSNTVLLSAQAAKLTGLPDGPVRKDMSSLNQLIHTDDRAATEETS
jgi:hypothetical protein